ncbi:MAG: exodeoxyribonuclease I [Deltaproteobacteria bacterium]|nr:exodeoxyribonuclease I [Deltaproteobacteria bacterium]
MNTYFFYDVETTGLNIAFDQILQFSAIRTDMTLNEIERHTIKIHLRPDVIVSPSAMITNRISVANSMPGLCEFEAVRQIHELINTPGTISLGYNSLGFDDGILRFSFHRNLLPPYTHQYENGCYRMDLLPMTIICRLYKKEVLNWPEFDGKPTMKLEHLNSANHLAEGPAHDALVDVKATVELAQRLFQEQEMWNYLRGYFNKDTDRSRVLKLPESFQSPAGAHRNGLMIGSEFGPDQNYQVPVLSIGESIPYGNQTLWLRLDLPELRTTTSETIPDTTWVIRKRYGEPGIVLPPRERYMKYLNPERVSVAEENTHWLRTQTDLFQKIIRYHRQFTYPVIPDLGVDAALYEIGFLSRQEQELCRRFHTASLEEKIKLVSRFPTAEIRQLAGRVICRNYDADVPKALYEEYTAYMAEVNPSGDDDALPDFKGDKRTTPQSALLEIKRLQASADLDEAQQVLLDELETYIEKEFPEPGIASTRRGHVTHDSGP